jgi:hypothetical protein
MMFDDMVKSNNIPIDDEDIRFVKALIAGDPEKCRLVQQGSVFNVGYSPTTSVLQRNVSSSTLSPTSEMELT